MAQENQDIRWKQRLQNYISALHQLEQAVVEVKDPSDLEKEGTIQRFEFTHELAWRLLKDYLEYEGIQGITGSRSTMREAYRLGLIDQGQEWMDMIETRNRTVHTYIAGILETEYQKIVASYFPLLQALREKMKALL